MVLNVCLRFVVLIVVYLFGLIYLGVGVAFYGGLCLVLIACGLNLDLCFEVFVVAGFVV